MTSDEGDGAVRPLWLSDAPASAELWALLLAQHGTSGLWPLLLDAHDPDDDDFRPWGSGELFPERMASPDAYDPASLLERWWGEYTEADEDDDVLTPDERLGVTASSGQAWPRPVPRHEPAIPPDELAAQFAQVFTEQHPQARLGLVAADCGAHTLTVLGWDGPANYDNTAKFAAVIRDWENRFGARVVAVGFDTLHLSVAAPPMNTEDALLTAAEHFAFCPDNVWQGTPPCTLAAYAERIVGMNNWNFWWD